MYTYRSTARGNGKRHTIQGIERQERDLALFKQERDEVLLTLDEKAIRAFYARWGVRCPVESLVFWAGIHKARTQIGNIPEEDRAASVAWLAEHGFTADIHTLQEGRQ